MKFFSIATVTSSLLLSARGQQGWALMYCNSNSPTGPDAYDGINWILLDNGYSSGQTVIVEPASCQEIAYSIHGTYRYHVCNITSGNENYVSDPECYPTLSPNYGHGGSYIGDLNITVNTVYPELTLQANFTSQVGYAQNMTIEVCRWNSFPYADSRYNIYINTTENLPLCPPYLADDDSDTSNDKKNHMSYENIMIVVLVSIFGAAFCAGLCFILLAGGGGPYTPRKKEALLPKEREEDLPWQPGWWRPRKDGGIDFKPTAPVV